jgi:hypothetical protein
MFEVRRSKLDCHQISAFEKASSLNSGGASSVEINLIGNNEQASEDDIIQNCPRYSC